MIAAEVAMVGAYERDSGASGGGGDAGCGNVGRVGGGGSGGDSGEEDAMGPRGGRGGNGEAGDDSKDKEESGDGMANEEEAMRRRLCVTGVAMMHPSKERLLGKYRVPMVASWST